MGFGVWGLGFGVWGLGLEREREGGREGERERETERGREGERERERERELTPIRLQSASIHRHPKDPQSMGLRNGKN